MAKRKTLPEANGEPAELTLGTVDQNIWLRPNGNVRVRMDAEGTRDEIKTQLQNALDYLDEEPKHVSAGTE